MKTILASALALGIMTSAAFAGPVKLTTAQMDRVTAGATLTVTQVNALVQAAFAGSLNGGNANNATVTQASIQSNESNENEID